MYGPFVGANNSAQHNIMEADSKAREFRDQQKHELHSPMFKESPRLPYNPLIRQ